eukprot:g29111.t1
MSSTHSAVPMEEAEEFLVVPEAPATPSTWRWKALGSVVVLALVGCAAFAYKTMPVQEPAWTSSVMQTINDWEDIPGIDNVIEHAKRRSLKQPLRNLNDLFYESQPEELPWIRTECVIDVVQGAAYLGQAVVFLYKAIDYDGLKCPNNSPVGCAASVAGFITSITWIASYLSFAANACGAAVNSGALCAGDWTALMANFGEMATVGAAVKEDCDFNKDKGFFKAVRVAFALETIAKVDALRTSKRNRNFDLTQCVMADVTNAASYIVRVILQIRSAASACPEPKACAINIMNIISSFAWISQFTALAVSDCWTKGPWANWSGLVPKGALRCGHLGHGGCCDQRPGSRRKALPQMAEKALSSPRRLRRDLAQQAHAASAYRGAHRLLAEVPEAPKNGFRWKLLGSVSVLALVCCVTFAYKRQVQLQKTSSVIQSITEWEEIPGIDKVIEHAKRNSLKQPLRNLNDLFYESQPEELPWIRTECVIDVVQGAAYLGQAVVFLYKAIDYDGLKCPNNSPVGCAASVAGFITSITWIASYLSFAANACGAAVNSGALCAGDWTALMANFGEMATVGAAVKEDCDFNKESRRCCFWGLFGGLFGDLERCPS